MSLRMQKPFSLGVMGLVTDRECLSPNILRKAASYGLTRVAGNAFILPADRSFWMVRGNRIMRLVSNEVDNGEHLPASPENPEEFLDDILGDLTFGLQN